MEGDQLVDDDVFVYTGRGQRVPRDVKRARIAENIDTIPFEAFFDRRQLTELVGHNKIKKICSGAFYNCLQLRRVMNMAGVIEIGDQAFHNCLRMKVLETGDKLEIIGHEVFHSCKALRAINISSIRCVGHRLFEGCSSLINVTFSKDLERVKEYAFLGCTSLMHTY